VWRPECCHPSTIASVSVNRVISTAHQLSFTDMHRLPLPAIIGPRQERPFAVLLGVPRRMDRLPTLAPSSNGSRFRRLNVNT